jgi:hypothetical protein
MKCTYLHKSFELKYVAEMQICGHKFVRFADLPQMWHFADLLTKSLL